MGDGLGLPAKDAIRTHVESAFAELWAGQLAAITALPIPDATLAPIRGALRLSEVSLPEWASEVGVDGVLLVPAELAGGWEDVDWWTAAFVLLECWHERAWEQQHGPVHSYSQRLTGWDHRAWDHAWVNRIAHFLGRWAGIPPTGSAPRIVVGHDVDAVTKTVPIRLKQGVMRAAVRLRGGQGPARGSGPLRFMFGRDDWDCVGDVLALEVAHGLTAKFHVFADPRRRSPRRWLMDPSYRLDTSRGRELLDVLSSAGVQVGLHPSFDSWKDSALLAAQRTWLEKHLGRPVMAVRQHWLRFSWADTWAAQAAAGLLHDSTLMFNDRAGFRNSAAITWRPWDHLRSTTHAIEATPCCFMDSHRYDYDMLATGGAQRLGAEHVIDECRSVNGTIEVLWHPHSLSKDYGWRAGFAELLGTVT